MANVQTSATQNIFRLLLGIFMVLAGIGHLSFQRQEFQAQVPGWVPISKDVTVILSGLVEIALGLGLLFLKKYRVQAGIALAIFYVLIFPGNIAQYINKVSAFGLDSDGKRLVRLFFQPVLIWWALWCSGAIRWFQSARK